LYKLVRYVISAFPSCKFFDIDININIHGVSEGVIIIMEFLDFPSMSCELRGAMSNGHLKLTDEKIVFQHAKSGKKDSVKVSTSH
jgi:hypothetical protein